ncbi:MAG: hypothetical protein ACYCS4_07830 [Acidimicrobiales bacterium]
MDVHVEIDPRNTYHARFLLGRGREAALVLPRDITCVEALTIAGIAAQLGHDVAGEVAKDLKEAS